MCQAKSKGGRRCASHAVSEYAKAVISKRATPESVTNKAEGLILSPVGKTYYEEKGRELVTTGSANAEKANRNAAFLKAAKFHQAALTAPAKVEGRPERDYMSESEKLEYDRCQTDDDRKDWWNRKVMADKEYIEEAAKDWRKDPSAYYDRLSMPNEHESLAKQKDLPVEYAKFIAENTHSQSAYASAVKQYANKMDITVEEAKAQLGEPAFVTAKRTADYRREIEKEVEQEASRKAYVEKQKSDEKKAKAKVRWKKFLVTLWGKKK